MEYESPAIKVIGPANELVQNYVGPLYDGDGYTFSHAAVSSGIAEE